MTSRIRSRLLATAASALVASALAAGFAGAVEISTETTEPVSTSTADGASTPGDVTLVSGGSITLDNGTAVTLDSDNNVTVNAGANLTISDADGAVGVRVLGGFTGTVSNSGSIVINESYTRTDEDGDGTLDGPFAQGSGRTGILIEGAAPFTGDIRNSGSIRIKGNDSAGIRSTAAIDGSIAQRGGVNVTGTAGVALDIIGGVTGSVDNEGSLNVAGAGSTALRIQGDVGGGVSNQGTITSTGFAFTNVSNYYDPDEVPDGYEPVPLDADDLNDNGPAVAIGASIGEGVLNNGFVGSGDADDDADGNDPVKDISGDFDVNRRSGTIASFGSAPAVLIAPDVNAAGAGDVVIGLVVERVRDSLDDDEDGDVDEILATFLEGYGFINRGAIQANGLNSGFESAAVVVRGDPGAGRNTVIEGGIFNSGVISSVSFEADTTTILIGDGASTPRFDNTGSVTAQANSETTHVVHLLLVESGAMLSALSNSGTLSAAVRGDGADVIAIQDLSGTLVSIDNTGRIVAAHSFDNDDDDGDGVLTDADEQTGLAVALDLSNHAPGQDITFVQQYATPTTDANGDGVIDTNDVATPAIIGDVLLGAGDDEFQLLAGVAAGDLSFGDGADRFVIDGGASYTGALSDSDGQLTIEVNDGALNLSNDGDINVTDLTLGDDAAASVAVNLSDGTGARIVAANDVSIAGGASITPQITGVGAIGTTLIEIMRAEGDLLLTGGQDIADNLSIDDSPFLFETTLQTGVAGSADTVLVAVRRRTADELGMNPTQAAAYDPVVLALNADPELLVAVVNAGDAEEFFSAYDQFLPEYAAAALQFAVVNVDGAIGAVGNRLDVVRGGREGAGGVWAQEFGAYMDREDGPRGGAFRGHGLGLAAGVDRPLGPFYAVGLNFVGAASEIEEPTGFDQPLAVSTLQLGGYAAAQLWRNLLLDVYGGVGVDAFESDRNIHVGDVVRGAGASWKGYHAAGSARLAYDLQAGRFFARPAVSLDYFRLDEEGYKESGGGGAVNLAISERTSDVFSQTASLTLGAKFGDPRRSWWSPRMRVGYRVENSVAPLTTARFISGGDSFILDASDLPESGGLFGFTFAAGSRWSSFALDYDADVRDGFIRHGARVAFRFVF